MVKVYAINATVLVSMGGLFITMAYYLNQFTVALSKTLVVGML